MAKQNSLAWYIHRCLELEARVTVLTAENNVMKAYTIQQAIDLAQITLHQLFHFGQGRNKEFERAYRTNWTELMQMALDEDADTKALNKRADSDLAYTVTMFDGALSDALGGECLPYKERYALMRLVRLAADMSIRIDPAIVAELEE